MLDTRIKLSCLYDLDINKLDNMQEASNKLAEYINVYNNFEFKDLFNNYFKRISEWREANK